MYTYVNCYIYMYICILDACTNFIVEILEISSGLILWGIKNHVITFALTNDFFYIP